MNPTCPYCARHQGENAQTCWSCGLDLTDEAELHQRVIEDKRRAGAKPYLILVAITAVVACFWLPAIGFGLLFLGLHLDSLLRSPRVAPHRSPAGEPVAVSESS